MKNTRWKCRCDLRFNLLGVIAGFSFNIKGKILIYLFIFDTFVSSLLATFRITFLGINCCREDFLFQSFVVHVYLWPMMSLIQSPHPPALSRSLPPRKNWHKQQSQHGAGSMYSFSSAGYQFQQRMIPCQYSGFNGEILKPITNQYSSQKQVRGFLHQSHSVMVPLGHVGQV